MKKRFAIPAALGVAGSVALMVFLGSLTEDADSSVASASATRGLLASSAQATTAPHARNATAAPALPAIDMVADRLAEARGSEGASATTRAVMAVRVPAEAELIVGGTALRHDEALRALKSEPIEPFLRQLGGGAGPVATALAFEYRSGVVATLPEGAEVRQLACGAHLCVLEAWFPDREGALAWSQVAFQQGGLPGGSIRVSVTIPSASAWRYRLMFTVDPRVNSVVGSPIWPPGG